MTTAMPLQKSLNQSSLPPMMVGNSQKSVNNSWEAGTPRSRIPPVNLPWVGHDPQAEVSRLATYKRNIMTSLLPQPENFLHYLERNCGIKLKLVSPS